MKEDKKKGANVPNLRFPRFEGEWEEKELVDLLEFKNGINASKEQYGKGIKFINVLDILNNDFITFEKIIGSVNVSIDIAAKYPVVYGDILFQRSSETREEVGTANVYLDKKHTATFGGFVIRGRKIGEYEPMFLNKLLKTDKARNSITSRSGGSTRYNVGQETLSSIELHFPTLPEQKIIASFLSLIDKRIETQSKIIENLESLMQGFREKIFSQDLRFKDDNGNEFPDWEIKKFSEVGTFFSGGTPATANKSYFNGVIPFIRSGEINADCTEQFISEEGLNNSSAKIVEVGDLLYALYGATSGEVGISKMKGAINQAILCIRANLNTIFLLNFLKLKKKNILKTYLQGGQGNLSAEIIKALKIYIPSFQEQTKIANFLLSIDTKIQIEKNLLCRYNEEKTYMLRELFL